MKWIVALLLLMTALAGCAETEPAQSTQTTDDGDIAEPSGNETTDAEPAKESPDKAPEAPTDDNSTTNATENLVPVLTVTADVINGTAPLLVNFTLSVDDDSENFTWAFLIDGNETLTGTEVPAAFNHTFGEGVYNLTFTLSDGEHEVSNNATIQAATAVPPPVYEEMSCDVLVGYGMPGASVTIGGLPVNLGGCSVGDITGPREVVEVSPGASCDIQADLDGDGFSDEDVQVGKTYQAGHTFTAFCYFGAADATNYVKLLVLD